MLIFRQRTNQVSSLALIEEKTSLLSADDIGKKRETVFLKFDRLIDLAKAHNRLHHFQTITQARLNIRTLHNRASFKHFFQSLDDLIAQTIHSSRVNLKNNNVGV